MFSISPYGEWSSPITTRLLVADSVRLGGLALDGECAYWLEGRPSEGGRNVLVCRDGEGLTRDMIPAPFRGRGSNERDLDAVSRRRDRARYSLSP